MSSSSAVVLLTVVFVLGVALIVLPPAAVAGVGGPRRISRRLGLRLGGAAVAGALVVATSGWLIPGVIVALGAFWVSSGWGLRRRSIDAEVARLEALAAWIESVRDVLLAGEQPIGAITSSVAACSPVIRPHVRRLAVALGRQDPESVFRRFADDLDDPVGDLVAAGLSIAVRRGARTVPVLTALAEQTREQVDRRRLIEAERAPTRREVQALTLIMGGLVFGLVALGRSEYLAAYDEPSGQVFLGAALAGYAALIIRVQRLAAFPRPSRFLTTGSLVGSDAMVVSP